MSNEVFECLYKKFENMIYKLCLKWSKLNIIEFDDLMQFALLELVNAAKTYDPTRGTKFSTYLYSLLNYRLRREIQKVKEKNKIKTVSIYSTVTSDEGSTAELIEIIADNLDLEEEITDKIMVQTYRSEIEKYLDEKKANIMILKYFHNMTNSYIEKVTNTTGISNHIRESRLTLIRRSSLFRNEYNRIHGVSDFSDPSTAII